MLLGPGGGHREMLRERLLSLGVHGHLCFGPMQCHRQSSVCALSQGTQDISAAVSISPYSG